MFLLFLLSFTSTSFALLNASSVAGELDLVRIEFTNGSACSGVFIDEFTILTAAHCLHDKKRSPRLAVASIWSEKETLVDVTVNKLVAHPDYQNQFWPAADVGVIKTGRYKNYADAFQVANSVAPVFGSADLFGCGRSENSRYSRTTGSNSFFRVGSVLFFVALSKGSRSVVAANDSGAPIVNPGSHNIIAIATTTSGKDFPILSTGTSILSESNHQFIIKNMGTR